MGTLATAIRIAMAGVLGLGVAGCYTSETAVLTPQNAQPIPGMTAGLYCHAENRLIPPQVTATPQISDAMGENRCRDLFWDAGSGRYVDRRSDEMLFRSGPTGVPPFSLLQVQTHEGTLARFMPVAATDGLFVLYDPAGEWPEDIVAAAGIDLPESHELPPTDPDAIAALLDDVFETVLESFRADVAFVEDAAGPRLEFKRVDTAYRYLVYFHEDWAGDTERMRSAMLALADALGLGKYDTTWTDHAE